MKAMERALEKYRKALLAGGAHWARLVPASYLVVSPWVRYKCQFGCSGFGVGRLCPPATPTPADTAAVIASYRTALLAVYEIPGGKDRRPARRKFHRDLVALERELFLAGHYKALAFVAGPCSLCRECDLAQPCKKPEDARPAMEAVGMDVYATLKNAGYKLRVVRDLCDPHRLCGAILIT